MGPAKHEPAISNKSGRFRLAGRDWRLDQEVV